MGLLMIVLLLALATTALAFSPAPAPPLLRAVTGRGGNLSVRMGGGGGDGGGRVLRVVGSVAVQNDQVFMAQRALGGRHGGLWEFPGGKVEQGEDDKTALAREVREELGVECVVGDLLAEGRDGPIHLLCYKCELLGEPCLLEHQAMRWVPVSELRDMKVPPADVPAVQALLLGIQSRVG